jgi:aminocarboxymuconate-semialdehyde decarboxylase
MRIDAYTHFIPEKYFNKIVESGHADIGKRVREIPCIHDLDIRRKIVDGFKDYAQILSYPMPPLEVMTKGDGKLTEEYTKLVNDGFAEICRKYPDQFPGWVGQAALIAPDGGVREAERALKNGALGVQIYTNIAGKPLDDPAFEPFFEAMNKSGKPVWMHPARAANFPDYLTEKKSKVRDLVDVRLVLRNRSGDGPARLLGHHGQVPEPEDHHAPFRRHRADAGRPHRAQAGTSSARAHRTKI